MDGLQNQNMDGLQNQNMDGQKHQNMDGLQNQKTDQSQHDDKLAEDRFAGWDGSGFETGKTTENVDEECTERILECFSWIGENFYDDIPDRLFTSMENVDKMKILWLAARIGPEKRSLIIEIAGEGLSIMNIKSICGILGECLSEDEMEQVAALAEKYTGLILQTEE
jgi:hypothetical protein